MKMADWEAMADRSPNELLPAECLPEVSKLSLEDGKNTKAPKRRGRGTFTYKKDELYSDRVSDDLTIDEVDDEGQSHHLEEKPILRPCKSLSPIQLKLCNVSFFSLLEHVMTLVSIVIMSLLF